jgi:hypothetical protein
MAVVRGVRLVGVLGMGCRADIGIGSLAQIQELERLVTLESADKGLIPGCSAEVSIWTLLLVAWQRRMRTLFLFAIIISTLLRGCQRLKLGRGGVSALSS